MPKPDSNQAINSGSMIVDNSEEKFRSGPGTSSASDASADASADASTDAPAGSPAEGVTDVNNADASGSSSSDTGSEFSDKLSRQLEELNSSIKGMGQQESTGESGQASKRDYDGELLELQNKATEGDITYSELITQSQSIQDAKTQDTVHEAIKQYDQQQQVSGVQNNFLQSNPDFQEFVNSPENQAIQSANPMMDNLSAYYANKSQSVAQENESMKQELATLKGQMQSSIKGAAADQTLRIGTEAGGDLRGRTAQTQENMTPKQGMLAALQAARQQNAG